MTPSAEHKSSHSQEAVTNRLKEASKPSYLRDIIYGAIDGAVTTFAIVAGVQGAGLSSGIILVLGISNLVADGFSMAASCYLGLKAEIDMRKTVESEELEHIKIYPEGEKEEVRQIYANLGFSGEDLERIIEVITSNKRNWVNTMIMHEFGLPLANPNPLKAGLLTFFSFLVVGSLPLIVYVFDFLNPGLIESKFFMSSLLAGLGFFVVGSLKSLFTKKSWFTSGLETLLIGGLAASVAYGIGAFLQDLALPAA